MMWGIKFEFDRRHFNVLELIQSIVCEETSNGFYSPEYIFAHIDLTWYFRLM